MTEDVFAAMRAMLGKVQPEEGSLLSGPLTPGRTCLGCARWEYDRGAMRCDAGAYVHAAPLDERAVRRLLSLAEHCRGYEDAVEERQEQP